MKSPSLHARRLAYGIARLLGWRKPEPKPIAGKLSKETARKLLAVTIAETSLPGALR